MVKNKDDELISTCISSGWRMCVDYGKLNLATCKDHFSLPFMDQMLERIASKSFIAFLMDIIILLLILKIKKRLP
jgi:hypothetical protein